MKYLKISLFIILSLSASIVHTQTRMDSVRLKLPSTYRWTKEFTRFKNDSTIRIQYWGAKNKKGQKVLQAGIFSRARLEMEKSFDEFVKDKLHSNMKGWKTTLIGRGKMAGGYRYALFKILVNMQKGNDVARSILLAAILTPTSLQFCLVSNKKAKLSASFIKKWSAILKHPVITPVDISTEANTTTTQTQFILSTPFPDSLRSFGITQALRRRFHGRLHQVYKCPLQHNDIKFSNGRIYITLHRNIDKEKVAKLLKRNNQVQFLPLYRGPEYQNYVQMAGSLFKAIKAKESTNIPTGFNKKHIKAAFLKIPSSMKGAILRKLRERLKGQHFPKGVKLYTGPQQHQSVLLYLVNTRHEILNESNITEVKTGVEANKPALNFEFDDKGSDKLAKWSRNHLGDRLSLVVNHKVFISPTIQGVISRGSLSMTGLSIAGIHNLCHMIQGSYPIPIHLIDIRKVKQ